MSTTSVLLKDAVCKGTPLNPPEMLSAPGGSQSQRSWFKPTCIYLFNTEKTAHSEMVPSLRALTASREWRKRDVLGCPGLAAGFVVFKTLGVIQCWREHAAGHGG